MQSPLRAFRIAAIALLALVALAQSAADATVVAYYRFESDLTTDSSGNGNTLALTTTTGYPEQVAIPAPSADGSAFPNPVPQTLATNTGMMNKFQDEGLLNRTGLMGWGDGSFTVEAMVNNRFSSGTYVLAAYESTNAGFTNGFLLEEHQNKITLELANGVSGSLYQSSFLLTSDDWYIAAAFDDAADTVTFYGKNLTTGGPLLSSTVIALNTPVSAGLMQFDIASWQGAADFFGVMDEFRLSTGALSEDQLLITPEPASVALLGITAISLSLRRRRRCR